MVLRTLFAIPLFVLVKVGRGVMRPLEAYFRLFSRVADLVAGRLRLVQTRVMASRVVARLGRVARFVATTRLASFLGRAKSAIARVVRGLWPCCCPTCGVVHDDEIGTSFVRCTCFFPPPPPAAYDAVQAAASPPRHKVQQGEGGGWEEASLASLSPRRKGSSSVTEFTTKSPRNVTSP